MNLLNWSGKSTKVMPPAADQKASQTGAMIYLKSQGQPVWSPRDFSSLAREGYTKNVIVYRSVRMVAEAVCSIPWVLFEGGMRMDEHPLLSILARPNEKQSGHELLENLVSHLLLAGNAYLEAVLVDEELRELHSLRPDRVKVVPGPDGWPIAYDYSVAGQTLRFSQIPEPMLPIAHLSQFHPLDDHYGFSPAEAAQRALDIHNVASDWNKALLDNAARPSGALVYQGGEGNLSDDQFERLKQELEASFQGAKNAGRPLLLEGGLDWKAISMSPREMDFFEARNSAAREIALAFGVPPQLLGIPGDNTYSNYQEANRAFWRQTVLPLLRRIAQSLENWFQPLYGEDLKLCFEEEKITALASERDAVLQRLLNADFLTINEKRQALNYDPVPGGDTL